LEDLLVSRKASESALHDEIGQFKWMKVGLGEEVLKNYSYCSSKGIGNPVPF
jgi:hypothetical protein